MHPPGELPTRWRLKIVSAINVRAYEILEHILEFKVFGLKVSRARRAFHLEPFAV